MNSDERAEMMRKVEADLRKKVATYGHAVTWVGPGPGPTEVPFGYTIGLHPHPELVVRGMPPRYCHAMLETLVAIVKQGEPMRHGDRWGGALEGYDVEMLELPEPWVRTHLGWAKEIAGEPVDGLLVMWPDKAGNMPIEPACDNRYRIAQLAGIVEQTN